MAPGDDRVLAPEHARLLGAIHALKHLPRKGWLEHGLPAGGVESVGSHTFGTAVLALVLFEAGVISKEIPLDRLLVVALLHDVVESVTGDVTPADHVPPSRKAEAEVAAARELFGDLPGLVALQHEVEAFSSTSSAARADPVHAIVRQVDKLDMMIQAMRYQHETGKDMGDFHGDPRRYLDDPALLRYFEGAKRAILG